MHAAISGSAGAVQAVRQPRSSSEARRWAARLTMVLVAVVATGCGQVGGDAGSSDAGGETGRDAERSASSDGDATDGETADGAGVAAAEPAATPPGLFDMSELVKAVRPGVVSVTQEQVRLDLFGVPEEVPVGAGTGVVIDDEGLVLTNHHVIAGAAQVQVTGQDGEGRQAEVVAEASARDLALLQLDDHAGLAPLPFADLSTVEVGDPVIAIGNALGLDAAEPTVSAGIVSALDRSVGGPAGTMQDLIQTDAAINPGNSGGPLLNASGEVVGINTAIIDQAQNVGFAISIDTAGRFIERFRLGVGEPFLGVSLVDNNPVAAERLDLPTETGALVVEVSPGSAAAEVGIERFDVITRFGNVEIETADDLTAAVLEAGPGDMVEIELATGQQTMTAMVTIGERPMGT